MIIAGVETKYLRYVPAKLREYVVWLERADNECDHSHVYFVTFEINGVEYNLEPCDTVDEITWYAKQLAREIGM